MAEKLDPRQVVTFEELLRACLYEQEATRRVLVRKGLLRFAAHLIVMCRYEIGGVPNERIIERRDNTTI